MASNGIPIRRNACQMFGIYRARTPEKTVELKPNRQTRACFLTAVISGVTLVVGLSLLDVSTNPANNKSTPVLHLTRHRQNLLPDNSGIKNINSNDEDIIGNVKEITPPLNENKTNNVEVTTLITTTVTTDSSTKDYFSNRNPRTKLYSVDKLHRTHIVKDYFIDGRHDPKSLGYYILQKQNGEYYLKNYSEPVWGTRIQRRFSNRIYSGQPDYQLQNNYNHENRHYIKRNDDLDYDKNFRGLGYGKGKENLDGGKIGGNPYHLAPFRRLTSSIKLDTVNDRIQNSVKQNSKDSSDSDYQLPPYEFTPIPIFSDSYAQLDPYKNNAKIKSIQEVMKYLTVAPKFTRPSTTSIPRMVTQDNLQAEAFLNVKSSANSGGTNTNNNQSNSKKRRKGVRFTGTYKMPIEPEDLKTGSSSLFETLLPPPLPPPLAKPYSGIPNGFTDIRTDPFANFRPPDPAEINNLLSPPLLNNNKNKQIGSMFINNIRTSTVPPNRFFPKPPFDVKKYPRPSNEVNSNYNPNVPPPTNGHTIAIFKPTPDNTYNSNNHPPNDYKRPVYQNINRKRRKPVSVTLDIYPMTMDDGPDHFSTENKNENINLNLRGGNVNTKDGQPQWISPTLSAPVSYDAETEDHDSDSSGSDSHMVVHLNVFPKGITRKTRAGKGRRPIWNTPETPRLMLTQKSADEQERFSTDYEEYNDASNINNEREIRNKNRGKHIEYLDYDFQEEKEDEIPISLYDNPQYDSPITKLMENLKNRSYNFLPKTVEDNISTSNKTSNRTKNNYIENKINLENFDGNNKLKRNIQSDVQFSINETNRNIGPNNNEYDTLFNESTSFMNNEYNNRSLYSLAPQINSQNNSESNDDYSADYPIEYY